MDALKLEPAVLYAGVAVVVVLLVPMLLVQAGVLRQWVAGGFRASRLSVAAFAVQALSVYFWPVGVLVTPVCMAVGAYELRRAHRGEVPPESRWPAAGAIAVGALFASMISVLVLASFLYVQPWNP